MADTVNVSIDEFLSRHKGFTQNGIVYKAGSRTTWDKRERSARFIMSAEVEDRDRDIIVQAGLDLEEFRKNPVAFFAHRSRDFPIGTWADVDLIENGRPKRTEGTLKLMKEGVDGVVDRVAAHIDEGTLKAVSIGFLPKAVVKRAVPEEIKDPYYWPGYEIREATLIECSVVPIPANPAAMLKAGEEIGVLAKDIIEEVLDMWVKTPAGVLLDRKSWEEEQRRQAGNPTTVTVTEPASPGTEPAPAPAPSDERGLFKRFLSFIGGETEAQDAVEKATQEARKRAEDAVAAAAAAEALEQRKKALEGRLGAKGL